MGEGCIFKLENCQFRNENVIKSKNCSKITANFELSESYRFKSPP